MEEIWKTVEGFENYQVSNTGKARSINYRKMGIIQELRPQKTGYEGYLHIILYKDGKAYQKCLSRIIYETFVGKIPEGMQVNHIDENIFNNSIDNLNLMSPIENNNWGTRIQRAKNKTTNGKCSKPVLQYDLNGNIVNEYPSLQEIKRQTGFEPSNICNYLKGKRKLPQYGYIWKYKEDSN